MFRLVSTVAGYDKLTSQGKELFRQIEELKALRVRVGYQHGKEQDDNGVDIADIAMFNEIGTDNAPARPFMRKSVDDNASSINSACKSLLQSITKGEKTAKDVYQTLGNMQKGLIQDKITSGEFTPNAPSTIRRKKSDKPLIDTGRMRQSVSFVIKKKGGD